jgi:hypothetical protein
MCSDACRNKRYAEVSSAARQRDKEQGIRPSRTKQAKSHVAAGHVETTEEYIARGGVIRRFDFVPPATLPVTAAPSARAHDSEDM